MKIVAVVMLEIGPGNDGLAKRKWRGSRRLESVARHVASDFAYKMKRPDYRPETNGFRLNDILYSFSERR